MFKSLTNSSSTAAASNTDTSSDNGSHNLSFGLDTSSSPDESPTRRSIGGIELAKIFAMDSKTGSGGCSEEKTPLLDSVEMSPISPTGPDDEDDEDDDREIATNIDGVKQKSDKM